MLKEKSDPQRTVVAKLSLRMKSVFNVVHQWLWSFSRNQNRGFLVITLKYKMKLRHIKRVSEPRRRGGGVRVNVHKSLILTLL